MTSASEGITQKEIDTAARERGMFSMSEAELLALITKHVATTLFAERVIYWAAVETLNKKDQAAVDQIESDCWQALCEYVRKVGGHYKLRFSADGRRVQLLLRGLPHSEWIPITEWATYMRGLTAASETPAPKSPKDKRGR